MTILCSDVVGLSSNYPRIILDRIVFLLAETFRELALKSGAFRFRGRRTIWWGCRVTWLAPRIGNDVSYIMWRTSSRTFILRGRRSIWWCWRVTLLAPRIGNDVSFNIADQWWHSFCVAGAVFGEVGGWLFVTGAALRDILGDSRVAKCCILQYKIVPKLGRVRSPKRRVRDDDFVVGCGRMCSDYRRIVFLLAEAFREFPLKSWASRFRGRRSIWWGWRVTWLAPRIGNDVSYAMRMKDAIHFAWQAQYLLSLKGDFTCSTQWKWRFRCDADEGCFSFCVAGGVFAEFEWWLYLLRAMEMTFHMCCCILS